MICDGNIHALNEEFAYIALILSNEEEINLDKTKNDFYKKYLDYLHGNNKDKCIEYSYKGLTDNIPSDFYIIYQPVWEIAGLRKNATLAVKFRREKNDNLTNEDV